MAQTIRQKGKRAEGTHLRGTGAAPAEMSKATMPAAIRTYEQEVVEKPLQAAELARQEALREVQSEHGKAELT